MVNEKSSYNVNFMQIVLVQQLVQLLLPRLTKRDFIYFINHFGKYINTYICIFSRSQPVSIFKKKTGITNTNVKLLQNVNFTQKIHYFYSKIFWCNRK